MERYGEKPKRFTAKWFEYVWEYYKLHIIVTLLVIAAVIYTWISIATRPFYDLYICLAGDMYLSDESKEAFCEDIKDYIEDLNGDGEKKIKILDYSVPENFYDPEYIQTMETKLYLEFQAGDAYMFIMPQSKADKLSTDESLTGVFKNASEWCEDSNAENVFVGNQTSDIFEKYGMSECVIGVRNAMSEKDSEILQQSNAEAVARAVLGR